MRSSLDLSAHQALSLAALTVALSACASLRVGSEFERGTNFSGYHTFKWLARERSEASNPVVIRGTQDAVQAELIRKGFTFVRGDTVADLVVDLTSDRRKGSTLPPIRSTIRGSGSGVPRLSANGAMSTGIGREHWRLTYSTHGRSGRSGTVGQRRN
jgi:hypothetical protein